MINIDLSETTVTTLPNLTAVIGPPNSYKTQLAYAIAEALASSERILVIGDEGDHYPIPPAMADVLRIYRLTPHLLTHLLDAYSTEVDQPKVVIVDSLSEITYPEPMSINPNMERAKREDALVRTLADIAQRKGFKLIVTVHERKILSLIDGKEKTQSLPAKTPYRFDWILRTRTEKGSVFINSHLPGMAQPINVPLTVAQP